jgi:hypothetical protein
MPIYLDPDTHQQLYVDPVTGEFRSDPASGAQPPPSAMTPATPMTQPPYPSQPYPSQQYPPPQYPPPYPYGPAPTPYGYGPARRRSGLAVASMVTSIVGAATLLCWGLGAVLGLVGAILGHVARRKIRRSGEAGDGMALAGIIVGWIVLVLGVIGAALVGVVLTDV